MRMMRVRELCVILAILGLLAIVPTGYADGECGPKVDGTSDDCGCAPGYCCSIYGFCGTTPDYCDQSKCQCQCPPPPPPASPPPPYIPPPPASPPPPYAPPPPVVSPDITEIITAELFDQLLLHRDDTSCPARGFYYYDAFVQAARNFPGFATTGEIEDRKREVAAFLGQTSHETTGGWDDAPDGRYAWGYCYKTEVGNPADMPSYCQESVEWPCVPGKKYYGRGPIQLSYNYNYGPCGEALGLDLLGNPDLVAEDTTISFEAALWFWMTPQSPKPSCHDVIIGKWEPSAADIAANRLPGYGVITNIINGGLECNTHKLDDRVKDRIGFYLRYCKILGVKPGPNLDCRDQVPFGSGLFLNSM